MQKAKQGKKQRKHGRNAFYCQRYQSEGRAETSQCVKLARHLAKFPNDACAMERLMSLSAYHRKARHSASLRGAKYVRVIDGIYQ